MPVRRTPKPIIDSDIPPGIARDTETAAAVAAHVGASDPHPIYLTQAEGDARYRQNAVALVDSDIPSAIARDTETAAALATHVGLLHATKQILITANAPSAQNGTTFISHSLDTAKVLRFSALCTIYPGTISSITLGPEGRSYMTGFSYSVDMGPNQFRIRLTATDSVNIVNLPIRILVDYVD